MRTSVSTRGVIDGGKRNFEARDFGLFAAGIRAILRAETVGEVDEYPLTRGKGDSFRHLKKSSKNNNLWLVVPKGIELLTSL